MAARSILGLRPFEQAMLTPGPLGHNDATSPDSPWWVVGHTPGPLGVNDYADPVIVTREMATLKSADGSSPRSMTISPKGLEFIWAEEYVEGISERLHWPGGASGVTLGAGYDLRARTYEGVAADLIKIGIDADVARKVADGAGLSGQDANVFVRTNRRLIEITDEQATRLLQLIICGYERIVQHGVKVPLQQHEFDALVSFAYNPGGRFRKVASFLNAGKVEEALDQIKLANTSGGKVLKGLVVRRQHEIDLFLYGRY